MRGANVPALFLLGILALGFALRVYEPVSRPDQWVRRSKAFNESLANGEWRGTYRSYHPGFTVMVAGGGGLALERAFADTPLHRFFAWAMPESATRHGREMTAGIVGMAAAITIVHGLAALALQGLGGWPFALVTAGLLSFSPFPLAQGRVFHPDGLLSALMLLSASLLLLALERGRRGFILASGIAGGLAVLTKTAAIFLFPFTGLALLVYGAAELRDRGWPGAIVERMAKPLLAWTAGAAATFFLWPAFWVDPVGVVGGMFRGIVFHVESVHAMPVFFAGRAWVDRPPGFLYYPASVLLDASFVTLTLSFVGSVVVLASRRVAPVLPARVTWMWIAFAGFFAVQMSLASNVTGGRYMLPTHLVLAVLAAAGWTSLFADRFRESLGLPMILLVLLVELGFSVGYAPDYGAHHNALVGGNRAAASIVAVSTQNEGVSAAGGYLAARPDAADLRVWTSGRAWKSLRQVFPGHRETDPNDVVDFHLFDHATIQRGLSAEKWGPLWEARREQPADFAVHVDGVDFVRLYGAKAPAAAPVVVTRGWDLWGVALAWAWTIGLAVVWVRR
jgi:hypothetical protein